MNKIKFHSNRPYNSLSPLLQPTTASKIIPKWYSDADLYVKDNDTKEYVLGYDGERLPGFKACPALLDIFTTGYLLTTPCDLDFYDKEGTVDVKTELGYEDFCSARPDMESFNVPFGYNKSHFHWWPNWAPETPEGHSVLYLNPINHFELPFITVAGIIDNDKFNTPGLMPFFLRKDFLGVIPKGTPYAQIIPFKRQDWEMELEFHDVDSIMDRHNQTAEMFRKPGGGMYKKNIWSRRKYK